MRIRKRSTNSSRKSARRVGLLMSRPACVFFVIRATTTDIYTLSLHDALPISRRPAGRVRRRLRARPRLPAAHRGPLHGSDRGDRKSTRLNSSHGYISYAVFGLKKKKIVAATYVDADKEALHQQLEKECAEGWSLDVETCMCFFCDSCNDHRHLHSFPTRRSSDLAATCWPCSTPTSCPTPTSCGAPWTTSRIRPWRSEEHTSELQSRLHLVCRLRLEKKKNSRSDLRRCG